MEIRYVVYRYTTNLLKDSEIIPLGVVVERIDPSLGRQIGLACVDSFKAVGASGITNALLGDIPTLLKAELDQARRRAKPGQDLLEALVEDNYPTNLHFARLQTAALDVLDVVEAAAVLYRELVAPRHRRDGSDDPSYHVEHIR